MNYRGNEKVSNRVPLSALPSKKQFRYIFAALLALVALLGGPYPLARANGPWYVAPTGSDANDCMSPATTCASINAAISKASPSDTIKVAIGTYAGTGTEVVLIDKDVTLSGGWDGAFVTQNDTSIIDGENARRGVTVWHANATIQRFTIQNGSRIGPQGGGIRNDGALTLNDSTVKNSSGAGIGGGNLILNNTTISGNTNNSGAGGIAIQFFGYLILNNSTVSGNYSTSEGGGIDIGSGNALLNSSTISNNSAGFAAGGVRNRFSGTLTLKNTIIAGNRARFGADCHTSFPATTVSLGYNLLGSSSYCRLTSSTGDIFSSAPLLGPLQDNGGTTETHALLEGSPAIDGGNPTGCTDQDGNPLATDQRGIVRPQGDTCDIGAFEFEVVEFIQVSIDVKPGGGKNSINLSSRGKVPVGVLTTSEFDAGDVDPVSVTFAGASPIRWTMEDVDGDGDTDLLFHFKTQELNLGWDSTEAILTGSTYAGVQIRGVDTVNIVPKD
jgi:hypothetical protein